MCSELPALRRTISPEKPEVFFVRIIPFPRIIRSERQALPVCALTGVPEAFFLVAPFGSACTHPACRPGRRTAYKKYSGRVCIYN